MGSEERSTAKKEKKWVQKRGAQRKKEKKWVQKRGAQVQKRGVEHGKLE